MTPRRMIMAEKEAKARVKINKLLEEAGWNFFDNESGKANILLENNVKLTKEKMNEFGEEFEKTGNGFIDFLLLDAQGFPFIVLEAKAEDKNPLFGKEQARRYAVSQNCRFIILSNGNIHYFWDLERGNPHIISRFPSPETVKGYSTFKPDRKNLFSESVNDDYIVLTQKPEMDILTSYCSMHKVSHLSFWKRKQKIRTHYSEKNKPDAMQFRKIVASSFCQMEISIISGI